MLSLCVYYDLYEWHSINCNFNARVSLSNSLSISKTIIMTEICSQLFCQQQQQAKGVHFLLPNQIAKNISTFLRDESKILMPENFQVVM